MGSYMEGRDIISYNKFQKIVKGCISCLAWFLMSMVGGLILVWWEVNYHPSNSQQWMVPIGLILMVTPVIVWFAAFVSETCSPRESYDGVSSLNQPVMSSDNSVHDPERR
ncbi:unnamed protein product [Camellia sinensis]